MPTISMTRPEKIHRFAWFAGLAFGVYGVNAWLVRHPPSMLISAGAPVPQWPLLFDMFLTVPLLYLCLFHRNGRRALVGAAMLAVAGVTIAGWIMPDANAHWLGALRVGRNLVAVGIAIGEVALAVGLARLVLRMLREGNDPEHAIADTLRIRFGETPIARLLAFEVRLWFYALFASGKRKLTFAGDEHFTCHAKDGHASNQQGFILLILVELPIMHVLLSLLWQPRAAWIVSVLSAWGLCFLVAEHRATLRRPISLDARRLYVRYGLAAELEVPLTNIASALPHRTHVARRIPGVLRYCEAGVPNICIHLDPALDVPDLFGNARSIEYIYLGVDAPGRFLERLDARQAVAHEGNIAMANSDPLS